MDRGGYDSTALSPGVPMGREQESRQGYRQPGLQRGQPGSLRTPICEAGHWGHWSHPLSGQTCSVCPDAAGLAALEPFLLEEPGPPGMEHQAHLSGPSQGRPCCCWQGYLPTPHRMVPSLLGTTGPHPCPQQANAQSLLTFTQPLLPRHPAQAPRPCCKACLLPSTGAAPGGARSRRPGWPYHGLLPPVPPGPCPAQPEGKGSLSGLRSGQNPTWQEGGCTRRSGRPLCPTPAGNHQELGRWSHPACPTMPAGDGLPEPGVLVCERKSLEG